MKVHILARPTPADTHYYNRWEAIGAQAPLAEADILVVDQHTKGVDYQTLPKLKYVCSATTGHTHLKEVPGHIQLVTLQGETQFLKDIRSVSEFTFRMVLDLARPTDGRVGAVLWGKTIGVLGLGRIGKHIMRIAEGFGMHVLSYGRWSSPEDLRSLFNTSDFISINLPESKETFRLISYHLIGQMKPTAYLINTARPSILNELALYQALRAGTIAGAALDVVDDPGLFSGMPNVITTPHIAGFTLEDRIKTDSFIVSKLQRIIDAN